MGRFRIAERGERLVYRIAGLPVALSGLWLLSQGTDGADLQSLDAAFASRYWRPEGVGEVLELAAAVVAWPVALVAGSLWYTARNSAAVRRRVGKGAARQIADQLRLYFSTGVLAPWYYIFSLDEDGEAERARSFLQRFQTKTCLFVLLKPEKGSPLNDKARFAQHCVDHGIRTVDVIMHLEGSIPGAALPDRDLFVKWSRGRGGRGAERWDRVADLGKITIPTLVIGAKYDTMDPAHMEKMATLVKKGRYLYCAHGSHMAMYDDQQTYVSGLIRFLTATR